MAVNDCIKEIQSMKHRANNIGITEAYYRTKIYNDNKAEVQLAYLVTSKLNKHINLEENTVQEYHQSKYI